MGGVVAFLLTLFGALACGFGGFLVGAGWQKRRQLRNEAVADTKMETKLKALLTEISGNEEGLSQAVDPLAQGGRSALGRVLLALQDHGGYDAIAVSDEAGLVLEGRGQDALVERMAVEAASLGLACDRVDGARQAILVTHPERSWTLHRYFELEDVSLSLSAVRRSGNPKPHALEGALGALNRVLSSEPDGAELESPPDTLPPVAAPYR